jgi:hypothetical protein
VTRGRASDRLNVPDMMWIVQLSWLRDPPPPHTHTHTHEHTHTALRVQAVVGRLNLKDYEIRPVPKPPGEEDEGEGEEAK